ncbi:MAG: cation:proton antiporter [Cyclobacteriaceae bacterium]
MEYYIIIAASVIIILSYFFNWVSDKTNFPSVLSLIMLGIIIQQLISMFGIDYEYVLNTFHEIKLLELLGTLGLILIVLEAALDLEIRRSKFPLILRSFFTALAGLLITALAIACVFQLFISNLTFINALIYATPLSILSSAIVIPSVSNLAETQKEFHIYESTFSDILGIMLFYFLISLAGESSDILAVGDFSISLVITIIVSISLSYLLLYVFQKLEAKVKLFLMIAVLILLFSVGKLMHLSSLIIILIFGIILSNHRVFFSGKFKNLINKEVTDQIYDSFHLITMESAFVVRTFFFVIFGFTVLLGSLLDLSVALISALVLLSIYTIRIISLKLLLKREIKLSTLIAPRGLITLLLYYSIPSEFKIPDFNEGILLFIIIISSLLMTYGLIKFGNKEGEKESSESEESKATEPAPEEITIENDDDSILNIPD